MRILMYKLQQHGDERGHLVSFEEKRDIPFEVKRVYYMFDTKPGFVRGKHAHKNLEQLLVCVHGSVKILLDDGKEREEVLLDNPYEGLYLAHNVWREMYDFSDGAVLMVFASEYYDEDDYIRDYDEFLKFVSSEKKKED